MFIYETHLNHIVDHVLLHDIYWHLCENNIGIMYWKVQACHCPIFNVTTLIIFP